MAKHFVQVSPNFFSHAPIKGDHVAIVVQLKGFNVSDHFTISVINPEPIISKSGELVFSAGYLMEFRVIQRVPYMPLGIEGKFLKLTLLAL